MELKVSDTQASSLRMQTLACRKLMQELALKLFAAAEMHGARVEGQGPSHPIRTTQETESANPFVRNLQEGRGLQTLPRTWKVTGGFLAKRSAVEEE